MIDCCKINADCRRLRELRPHHQPEEDFGDPPREIYSPLQISIDGTNFSTVEHFSYLCRVISNDATVSRDLDNCLPKAISSFEKLSKKSMAESLALPLLEDPGRQNCRRSCPPVRRRDIGSLPEADQLIERSHQRCLRSILGIRWQDYMPKRRSLQKPRPAQHRVHLASGAFALGWQVRKDGRHSYTQSSLLQRLQEGKGGRGAPRKPYKDQGPYV